jgi:RHS repeat-associated protein
MLAAKEQTGAVFPLAAFSHSLPKTRVWGSTFENQVFIRASGELTSTMSWGCGYIYGGKASGSLDQRFYASTYGRFNTPDPYKASGFTTDPASWNRYAYTRGDPINRVDRTGRFSNESCGSDGGPANCTIDTGTGSGTGSGGGLCDPGSSFYDTNTCQGGTGGPGDDSHPPPPQWYLDVGFTPVLDGSRAGAGAYNHLYIWIHLAGVVPGTVNGTNSIVLDGGPSASCLSRALCGNVFAATSTTGIYNEVNNRNGLDFYSQSVDDSAGLAWVKDTLKLSVSLSGSKPYSYNPVSGPNSNSVVYTLLRDFGVNAGIGSTSNSGVSVGILGVNGGSQYFTGWGQYLSH